MQFAPFDSNNLHGWCMSQLSPYKDIEFSNSFDISEYFETDDYAEVGDFLEFDLHYPNET